MDAYHKLDLLIDRFKHDVREIIDSAVASERTKLMSKLEAFIDTDGKSADVETVQTVKKVVAKVVTINKETIDDVPETLKPKDKECGFCKRRGEPCVKHGGKPSQYVPKPKKEKPAILLPAHNPPAKEESAQLSNRPLIEFVGTKKKESDKPFLCGYCGKPCDDRYCSNHCESEDKRLATLNKGKSYSEYLSEKGIKQPVQLVE